MSVIFANSDVAVYDVGAEAQQPLDIFSTKTLIYCLFLTEK